MSDAGAGGSGAPCLRRAPGSEYRSAAVSRARSRQRAVLAAPRSRRIRSRFRSPTTSGWSSRIRTGTGRRFDFSDRDDFQAHQKAEAKFAPIMNATNPDLRAFHKRGGKLLQWHGWNDQLIAPQNSIDYHESVRTLFGAGTDVQSFYRLFMAPGMAHCSGGTGPNTFDMQGALEQWVERGVAPDRVDRRPARSTASSIACVRCARIRRSRVYRAAATPTMRRTSAAGSLRGSRS